MYNYMCLRGEDWRSCEINDRLTKWRRRFLLLYDVLLIGTTNVCVMNIKRRILIRCGLVVEHPLTDRKVRGSIPGRVKPIDYKNWQQLFPSLALEIKR